jgi:hypothetical protein
LHPGPTATTGPTAAGAPGSPAKPGIVLTPQLCAQLRAQAMNGADYVPGIDAYGRPVAPADLPQSGTTSIGTTTTNILIDPSSRRASVPANGYPQTLAAQVAVGPDGRVRINGQPVGQDATASLRALCTQQGY